MEHAKTNHSPAVKVAGRRLSASKPIHHPAPHFPEPEQVVDEPTDYPRPAAPHPHEETGQDDASKESHREKRYIPTPTQEPEKRPGHSHYDMLGAKGAGKMKHSGPGFGAAGRISQPNERGVDN
ncbi:hypothetical protein FRC03_001079 [Tulasnella sp. 419]|nr:hypothetical protein FRC03_001079 [Tulasnella sp. 419]